MKMGVDGLEALASQVKSYFSLNLTPESTSKFFSGKVVVNGSPDSH